MNPKKRDGAFTSIRIIGKKAQNLLAKAKQNRDDAGKKKSRGSLPEPKRREELLVHLSTASIVKSTLIILAIIAAAWILINLSDKIILLLFAAFLAVVIDPGVQAMQRWGIPRGIAVLIHYFIAIFLLLFLLLSFIPIISRELQSMAIFISNEVDAFLSNPLIDLPLVPQNINEQLTTMIQTTLQDRSINQFSDTLLQFGQNLSTAAQGSVKWAAQLAGSVLGFIVSFIIVLVLAFFIQIEKEKILEWFRGFIPQRFRSYLDIKQESIHIKLSQWARGELLLMFSIFALTLFALLILGMPYALTLAVLAGFCELIPAVGPFIAAVPAVLIALNQEGIIWALVLVGTYYIIQWCENNLLVPLIMKRAVGLSPIAILFAMLVGISFPNTLHPVLGVMLAIPATTIITLFLEDWRGRRQ